MNGADAAGVSGAPGLQEIKSFGTANLANRDPIRPQSQRRPDEIG